MFAENPYSYSNDLLNALVRARRRGVDVRVYIYPGMTHVKALLVDGWACFGSANFDA